MARISLVFAQSGTASDASVDFSFYVVLFVGLAVVAIIMRASFTRRAKRRVADTVTGASNGPAIRIAPAPPFPEDVARLRALLGESTPQPRISRYTVPIVTADSGSLTIRDKKLGVIVSIPLNDIASIEARDASITPKGTILPRTYPSLCVTVRRGTTELTVALTPIVGAYDKVRPSDVEAMAAELHARLATTQH